MRTVLAVVVVLAALTGCTAQTPARPPGAPSPAPPPVVAAVDVVAGGEIWAADGTHIPIGFAGDAAQVWRTPAGWLVVNNYATPGGWLIDPAGQRHPLWTGVRWPVVSPDGTRIAYRLDDRIVIARLTADGLSPTAETGGVGSFYPNRFLGIDRGLLLGSTETGGGIEHYDVWDPAHGPYQPTPATPNLAVLASTQDGRQLIGAAASDGTCLAVVDSHGFGVLRKVCQLRPHFGPDNSVSSDERWLLGRLEGPKDNTIVAVDLAAVFDRPELAVVWTDRSAYQTDITRCVWPDPMTALCAAQGGLARLRMDHPGDVELLPVMDGLVTPVVHRGTGI